MDLKSMSTTIEEDLGKTDHKMEYIRNIIKVY